MTQRDPVVDASDEQAVLGQGQPASRARSKFRIDLIIFALWVFICAPQTTGLAAHEWVSFAFIPPLVLHLLLSWKWIVALSKRVLSKLPGRSRFNYWWNLALFVLMGVCIVSGVVVSEVALPALGVDTGPDPFWGTLHDATANFLLIGIGVHLAMHANWIVSLFRRLRTKARPSWRDGGWRESIRPLRILGIVAAMTLVGLLPMAFESSSWAEEIRRGRERHAPREAEVPEAAEPSVGDSDSDSASVKRGAKPEPEAEPQQRRNFPPWARYVLPFVKQAVLMGVPALLCLGLLAILGAIRRRRRR